MAIHRFGVGEIEFTCKQYYSRNKTEHSKTVWICCELDCIWLQYIPRNMHTVFALLCFVVVIHWLIFPYPSGLLHWHCGNLTIAPVPAKQAWWIWINTSCEFIMNDCITTTKQSTTKTVCIFLGIYCIYCCWQNTRECYLRRVIRDTLPSCGVFIAMDYEFNLHWISITQWGLE